jgi:LPXTG-motif cell wall-anchored protein
MKKIFQLFLAITLVFAISACTSKKVDDQTDDATADMTGEEESGEVSEEDFGGDESSDTATTDEAPAEESTDVAESTDAPAVDENAAIDESGLAESSDTALTDESTAEATPSESTDSSDMEGLAASTEETPSEMPSETPAESAEMGSETPEETSGETSLADSAPLEEAPAPAVVPLRKIETTPWTQGNVLVNGVYLARQGDNFSTVSQKIYGSEDKVSEMRKINPTIARREMKVGDKVYYNSPKRPTDNTQLLTFYEDNGLAPETYVSQPGENIRTISKNLLGDNNSWKEIWSTNLDVESKSDLPEGTRLRYWAGEVAAPAPVVAQQETPPPAMPEESAAAAGAVATDTPQPPSEMPPPPMPDEAAQQAQMAPPPPIEESLPPEPVVAEAPPAPVDAGMAANSESTGNPLADLLGGEDQTTALMIGALFLIAAAALFIIIKKRKSKKNIDFQTATHTQIE